MVKTSETFWSAKIAEFEGQQNRTESECSSFLYDILQGLYEDISETTKIELLLVLQEYVESLIQTQELAEHAVGSIKCILKDLLADQHDTHYVINCLVTTTTLIIQFELNQLNPQLVKEITQIFVDLCKRVNIPNETLIRKVACDCLFELETAIPSILSKCIYLLFDLTKKEKSFAAQSYMLLLSTVLCNILQYSESGCEDLTYCEDFNTTHHGIGEKDEQQITSFLAGDLSNMSTVILWQIGQKIGFLFENLHMPKVVLQNKMIQCCYSSDLQVIHLGLLLAFDHLQGVITSQDLNVLAHCLLRLIKLPVFPNGVVLMCLQWFLEVVRQIDFLGDSEFLLQNVFDEMIKTFPFDPINIINGKIDLVANLLQINPTAFDFMKSLEIPLKMVNNGIGGQYSSLLFKAFYFRFNQTGDKKEKERIANRIVHMTIEMPKLLGHTIDFIMGIKKGPEEQIKQNIIHQIAGFILKLEKTQFLAQSDNYFPLIEQACSEARLWPYGVIKWLRSLCLTSTIYTDGIIYGDWMFGSEILSVCKAILRTHDSLQILQELADFLWFIHKRFQDQDIRDRALFFYMIIGCASPKYFTKLFAQPGTEANPQSASKKGEVEIPADLVQGVLPTIRLDSPCFSFKKAVQQRSQKVTCLKESLYTDMETYKMVLEQYADKSIDLDLNVAFREDAANHAPSKVYALTIKFNSNGNCKEIPDALVPYTCAKPQSKKQASKEQLVKLKLYPFDSLPFKIGVSCTFMNEQGRICVAPAKQLQLNFFDFFQPLISASDDNENGLEKRVLFECLWKHFKKNQKAMGSSEQTCVLSVKRLDILENKISDILEKDLRGFCVEKTKQRYKIGVFLSPANHILMDFKVAKEETTVWICIDNWKFLDLVGDFLDELVLSNK